MAKKIVTKLENEQSTTGSGSTGKAGNECSNGK